MCLCCQDWASCRGKPGRLGTPCIELHSTWPNPLELGSNRIVRLICLQLQHRWPRGPLICCTCYIIMLCWLSVGTVGQLATPSHAFKRYFNRIWWLSWISNKCHNSHWSRTFKVCMCACAQSMHVCMCTIVHHVWCGDVIVYNAHPFTLVKTHVYHKSQFVTNL